MPYQQPAWLERVSNEQDLVEAIVEQIWASPKSCIEALDWLENHPNGLKDLDL